MLKRKHLIWITTLSFLLLGSISLAAHGPWDAAGPPDGSPGGEAGSGPGHALGPGPGVPPSPAPGPACGDGGPGGISPERPGYIHANRHVFRAGDPLRLRLCLPEPVRAVIDAGEAQLFLVVLGPAAQTAVQVDTPFSEDGCLNLVDGAVPETLEGPYQIGLVLVVPDTEGDAVFDARNWYGGWRGLLGLSRLKFASGEDPEDLDGDGEVDDDCSGNGFPD